MDFIKICGITVLGIILTNCLPIKEKSIAMLISISVTVLVVVYIIDVVSPLIVEIKNLLQTSWESDFSIIIKIIGISILTQFVSDFCEDSGNKSLANTLQFAGKVTISFFAIPVYLKVFKVLEQILK